jgi:hypothetical protein
VVVFPQHVVITSTEEIRQEIHRFQWTINEIRQAIAQEMKAWTHRPQLGHRTPRNRDALPQRLVSVDGNGNIFDSGENDVYIVNENFWNTAQTIRRYLDSIDERYRTVVNVSTTADVVHPLLLDALPRIHSTLAQLPSGDV